MHDIISHCVQDQLGYRVESEFSHYVISRTPGIGSRFADHSVEHKLVAGQALFNDAKSTAT